METLVKFFELFFGKVAPLPFFVLAVVSGVLLFGTDHFLTVTLPLMDFRKEHIQWIALAFLVSAVYTGVFGLKWSWARGEGWWHWRARHVGMQRRLCALTGPEKQALQRFFIEDNRVVQFALNDAAMNSLRDSGILVVRNQMTMSRLSRDRRDIEFPVNVMINDYAWNYLYVNTSLLTAV